MHDPPRPPERWERQLHARLLAGDQAALAALYDRFATGLYRLALRVTGDRGAAEDVIQEVFLHLWEHPDGFDPDRGTLRTWLSWLAHCRAVDWVRRAEARRRRAAGAGQPPPPPSVEEAAVTAAVAQCVQAAVDELPAAQRDAVLLAYFEGRTYRQVAEILGIPEGTAKSRLRLGLRRIADRLRAEGLDTEP